MAKYSLSLFCVIILVILNSANSDEKDTICDANCIPYHIQDVTTVIYQNGGRLGNHMTAYAMMLGMNRAYGFRTYIQQHVLNSLNYYFENIVQLPVLSRLCNDSYPWEHIVYSPYVYSKEKYKYGLALEIPSALRLLGGNLIDTLRWDIVFKEIHLDLEESFVFREKFRNKANDILTKISSNFIEKKIKKNKKKKKNIQEDIEITFVGVHIRKTDFSILEKKYGMPKLLPSYYLEAMSAFEDQFNNVVFVIVGDNIQWAKENIIKRVRKKTIFIGGDGNVNDLDAIGFDLALLSQCNHTILSYGTFSSWAGFLSGGKRIIPSLILKRNRKVHPLDVEVPTFAMSDHGLNY